MSLLSKYVGGTLAPPKNENEGYPKVFASADDPVFGSIKDIAKKELDKFRFLARKYFAFDKDPSKAAWLIEWAVRKDPVELPPRMTNDEWSYIKYMYQRLTDGVPGFRTFNKILDALRPKIGDPYNLTNISAYSEDNGGISPHANENDPFTLTHKNIYMEDSGNISPRANENKSFDDTKYVTGPLAPANYGESTRTPSNDYLISRSSLYSSPYKDYKTRRINSLTDINRLLMEMDVKPYYSHYKGFEPGTNHDWMIQLFPYRGANDDDLINDSKGLTLTPPLPEYRDSENNVSFSYAWNTPVSDYNLQLGMSTNKQVPIYKGSVEMPDGIDYSSMAMNLTVLDDVSGNFRKYINSYYNRIYDLGRNAIARYDQAAFLIRLIIFEHEYKIKHELRLIGCPSDYQNMLSGSESPSTDEVQLTMNIIGMKRAQKGVGLSGTKVPNNLDNDWTNVVLSPNNIYSEQVAPESENTV